MNTPKEEATCSSTRGSRDLQESLCGTSSFSIGSNPSPSPKSLGRLMDNTSPVKAPSSMSSMSAGVTTDLAFRNLSAGSSRSNNSMCHFLNIPPTSTTTTSSKPLTAPADSMAGGPSLSTSGPSPTRLNFFQPQSSSSSSSLDQEGGGQQYNLRSPTITSTMVQQTSQAASSDSSSAICHTSEFFNQGSKGSTSNLDEEPVQQQQQQQQQTSSESPDSLKRSFVPCKVCGDKASGYHYGVTSCEGCKGFFRRSIQKQIEYRCLRDGKCMIIRLNRNRCQYCRFKKCLAVGMSRDSVRYGRVPKRSKSTEDHSVSSTDSSTSQDQSAIESKQLAIYDIILNISQAHHAHCAITEDKIKTIPRNPASLRSKISIPPGQILFTTKELEMQRLLMWQHLTGIITPSIHSIVEFSKRVPNFSELSQDDQLILIKTGFFEIWLIRMSRMILKEENVVVFENGSCIPREELAVVYTRDFVTSMFDMVTSFNMLNLNDTEIALFTGIVLTTADRQGLSDSVSVERIQDQLVEALQLQISRSHSTEENLFASIIMKAPELRTLGSRHNDLLRWYRAQWHRISLPPLFAEIYDIPKNQSDAQTS